MKRSSGILVYKKENNEYKVFLCHMGGPYWQNKELGAWSIPKGEYSKGEKAICAAKREFNEETSLTLNNELEYLGSKKVSNKKLVNIFTVEEDINNLNIKSNYFEKEWPKGSGKIVKFPEMDKANWFTLDESLKYILPNQQYFINKLKKKLNT